MRLLKQKISSRLSSRKKTSTLHKATEETNALNFKSIQIRDDYDDSQIFIYLVFSFSLPLGSRILRPHELHLRLLRNCCFESHLKSTVSKAYCTKDMWKDGDCMWLWLMKYSRWILKNYCLLWNLPSKLGHLHLGVFHKKRSETASIKRFFWHLILQLAAILQGFPHFCLGWLRLQHIKMWELCCMQVIVTGIMANTACTESIRTPQVHHETGES